MSLISYLAEDNETIAKNLIETLREICEVKVVAVGATQNEASHWLADHDTEWDLAIVDLFLREGSGLGVLAGCRNRALRQKVVVLTNYATPEIRKRATELGPMRFLTNPASWSSCLPIAARKRRKLRDSVRVGAGCCSDEYRCFCRYLIDSCSRRKYLG